MKKRILSMILAVVMVVSMACSFAFAAGVEDFSDVAEGKWYYDYVDRAAELGYFIGLPDGTFSPETTVNRAAMVLVLARMAQRFGVDKNVDLNAKGVETHFVDVPENEWYAAAVKWAYDSGITTGVSATKFMPREPVTREDACTFIIRFLSYMSGKLGKTYSNNKTHRVFEFKDEANIRAYAATAVDECMAYGIVHGTTGDETGYFHPRETWKRCEGAKMISILHDVLSNPDSNSNPNPNPNPDPDPNPTPTPDAKPVVDLKSALESGGDYYLTGDAAADSVVIADNVVSTLDLKGYTLTVGEEWLVNGGLTITNGDIIIEMPDDEEAVYMESGICVEAGTLNLEDVNIIGKRLWNIENNGTLYLANAEYTVNGGYGISNSGVAVIENCTLIANGEATSQIYSIGGTMSVTGTDFVEGSDFVSYYYMGAIEAHDDSEITLDDVNITTGADENSVFVANSSKVVIKSGTINTKVACIPDASITIYGGTINGIAFEDITADSDIFIGAGCKLTKGQNCWIIGK